MPARSSAVPRWAALVALSGWAGCAGCTGCTCEPPGDVSSADRSDGEIPELTAVPVEADAIRIDGRLDEAAWDRAGDTGPFVRPSDGRPEPGSGVNASARLLWDPRALYVAVTVQDAGPSTPFGRDEVDPHLWERASGVELMIQPGDPGDNRHYYEVQVDVGGAVWDTRFDDYNRPIAEGPDGRRFGHQSWSSQLERAVAVDEGAGSYTVEMALPWGALEEASAAVPPEAGDTWRVNLYSFRDGQREAMAWSPLLGEGNFHRTSRFGRVTFGR